MTASAHASAAEIYARIAAMRLAVDAIEAVRIERNVVEPAAAMWAAAHGKHGGIRAATAMIAATLDELKAGYADQLAQALLAATLIDARALAAAVIDDVIEDLWTAIDRAQLEVARALGEIARAKRTDGDMYTRDPCPDCGEPITRYRLAVHRRAAHGVI